LRAAAPLASSCTAPTSSRARAGEKPQSSSSCIIAARAGARSFRPDHAMPASSRCISDFIEASSRINCCTRPSLATAAGAAAPGMSLAAIAVISMPPSTGRLEMIIASSPSDSRTLRSTSREVVPKNVFGVMPCSRQRM
jgi:hypothetical protein